MITIYHVWRMRIHWYVSLCVCVCVAIEHVLAHIHTYTHSIRSPFGAVVSTIHKSRGTITPYTSFVRSFIHTLLLHTQNTSYITILMHVLRYRMIDEREWENENENVEFRFENWTKPSSHFVVSIS